MASSAFGMGIDVVYRYDAPHSIDADYQEIGRAGRDGEPADAILFNRPRDLGIAEALRHNAAERKSRAC
jgi:ATP-dependent DNA helicase RecQ